jgi:hypothetical protein
MAVPVKLDIDGMSIMSWFEGTGADYGKNMDIDKTLRYGILIKKKKR